MLTLSESLDDIAQDRKSIEGEGLKVTAGPMPGAQLAF